MSQVDLRQISIFGIWLNPNVGKHSNQYFTLYFKKFPKTSSWVTLLGPAHCSPFALGNLRHEEDVYEVARTPTDVTFDCLSQLTSVDTEAEGADDL